MSIVRYIYVRSWHASCTIGTIINLLNVQWPEEAQLALRVVFSWEERSLIMRNSGSRWFFKMVSAAALVGVLGASCLSSANAAGKIVVANDEWTLADGCIYSGSGTTFATNVTNWFTGGKAGKFLVDSFNFGLTGGELARTEIAAGNEWAVMPGLPTTAGILEQYDGVFLAGYTPGLDCNALIQYVKSGGNVYLCGGTGMGGEADTWNPFLNAYGLGFASNSYNGVGGVIGISSDHPIFNGVTGLYQDNGNTIIDLDPANDANKVLVGPGLYAVYDGSVVPEPSSLLALCTGFGGLAAFGLRRRRS